MKIGFDIGSNIGKSVNWFLSNGYDKIICLEPNDTARSQLIGNYGKDNRVVILDQAISDEIKEITFYDCPTTTISTASTEWVNNSRFSKQYTWYENKKTTINIDTLCAMYDDPEFIKIDVEGYELIAIKGLTRKVDCTIAFEWAEEVWDSICGCIEHLESLGYDKFAFTYDDDLNDMPEDFTEWKKLKIHDDINVERKDKWGMIYAR